MLDTYFPRLYRLLERRRRTVALGTYAVVTAVGYLLAYVLRFEFAVPTAYLHVAWLTLPVLVGIRLLAALFFRLSTGRWRFVGTRDIVRLTSAVVVGTMAFSLVTTLLPWLPYVPRSVILMEAVLTMFLTAGVWMAYRMSFEFVRHHRSGINGSAQRVLLIGAGEAGNLLAREMCRFPTGYRPVGFVDDMPTKWGTSLHGLRVFGSTADLPRVARQTRTDQIIIAVPSASPAQLRGLVRKCEETGLPFKVLPGISDVLMGDVRLTQVRDVLVEDLLGREPIQLEFPEVEEDLAGRSVLITGAAGSIGSELARQVALYRPGALILFDQSETDLYYLGLELREEHPGLTTVSVVGDVVDAWAVERVFTDYAPDRVFHAAAYKHVPMMETHPREAVRNNVIGTWRVADAAGRHGAAKFVLVSTDKAVRPVSIMGATKRLAEIVVVELQGQHQGTAFTAVRFGNVLGSNGSVIPVFRRQLNAGKPLTVTHPEATRYFMTIAEAVQLILQAARLPDVRGHIAMLEMGEPVRILELAENLLRLSGIKHPEENIVFTGLRPGERLHEELVAPEESTHRTSLSKVRVIEQGASTVAGVLVLIQAAGEDMDAAASEIMSRIGAWFPKLDGDSGAGATPTAAGTLTATAARSG